LEFGVSSIRIVWSPILTFLMLGMSIPATRRISSESSISVRTLSSKYEGVSTMMYFATLRSPAMIRRTWSAVIWSA
jgi:hypothetical protein